MKHLRFALVAVAVAWWLAVSGLDVARAQTCSGLAPAAETGDSTFTGAGPFAWPSVADLVSSSSSRNTVMITPFGMNSCIGSEADFKVRHDASACSTTNDTYGDLECGSRRMLNAVVFLDKVPFNSTWTWRQRVAHHVDWTVFIHDSCHLSQSAQQDCVFRCGTFGEQMWLYQKALFTHNLIERAAIIAHEGVHAETGKGHCDEVGGCFCQMDPSLCDPSYSWGGAYGKHIDFLDAALNVPGLITNPFQRKRTLNTANRMLVERFETHPGFVIQGDPESGATETVRKPWDVFSGGPIQIAWNPDPDGPVEYIQGIGVASHGPTRTVSALTIARGVMDFVPFENKRYRGKYESHEPQFGDFNNESLTITPQSHLWLAPTLQRFAYRDLVWPPRALTRLALRAGTDGTTSHMLGRRSNHIQGYAAVHDATIVTPSTPASWDIDVATTSGHLMTGLSLGVAQSGTHRFTGIAWNQRLGPEFKCLAGGYGGSSGILTCPSGYIPVGTQQKAANSAYGPVVGYFAIVCAPESYQQMCRISPQAPWTPCANIDTTRIIQRASYREGSTFYAAGQYPHGGSGHPTGLTEVLCIPPSRLRGIVAQSGALVDRINSIRCTDGSAHAVNVGGTGGAMKTHDCWLGASPAIPSPFAHVDGIYFRSGDLLDGLATRCMGPFDSRLAFDSDADGGLDVEGTNGWEINVPNFENNTEIGDTLSIRSGAGPRRAKGGTGPPASCWSVPASCGGPYALFSGAGSKYFATLTRRAVDLRNMPAVTTDRSPNFNTYLRFRYHMYHPTPSAFPGEVAVLIRPTGSTAGVTGTLPFSVMTVSDLWRLASISLAPWRGQVIDIQIRLKRMTSPFPDIAVDDLRIVTEAEVLP